MVGGSESLGRDPSPPRRGKATRAKPKGKGRGVKKNLDVVYQEAGRMARGGGSRAHGTGRETGRRAAPGAPRRRGRGAQEREAEEVVMEREAGEGEEAEREAEASEPQEESDDLPPADGSDSEGEGEEEGGPEQEADSTDRTVYLRGPVSLPQSLPLAERPFVQPGGHA